MIGLEGWLASGRSVAWKCVAPGSYHSYLTTSALCAILRTRS